jgi:hypothetical protein
MIVARILVVPNPNQRPIHQVQDARDDPFPRHARQLQVAINAAANRGKRRAELVQRLELGQIPMRGPTRMISILPTTPGVDPSGL